jgi:hypothetical protein
MACDHPKEEWTVSTINEVSGAKSLLVFCLSIDGTTFTGEVSELPVNDNGDVIGDPVLLSDEVTGTDEPVGAADISFMTFLFPWGEDIRVMLAGIRFRANTPDTFKGRFTAFARAEEVAHAAAAGGPSGVTIQPAPQPPGDGDTGTGTGTQT